MNEESEEIERARGFLVRYIEASSPVFWLGWMGRCADVDAKAAMETVLFEGGAIRDLTDAQIREEVLEVIFRTPPILQQAVEQLASEVDGLGNQEK
jgi:hypothetical protein